VWTVLAATVGLGLIPSLTGHSSVQRDATILADVLHVFGAGAWAGGLLYLAITHRSFAAADEGRARLLRFSRLTTITVLVVLASGVVNTWVLSGGPGNFVDSIGNSAYANTLAVKLGIVAVVLVLGWMNRRSLADGLGRSWPRVRLEAVGVVGIIVATGLLVGMVPPGRGPSSGDVNGGSPSGEFQGVDQAGAVTVRMQVIPAEAGPNQVHLYFLALDGSLAEVAAAELKVSSDVVEPRRVPLTIITASHAIAPEVDLTKGVWDFEVMVVAPPAPRAEANFEVTIQ
jgi:uncharacterized membrane protein